jgi:hypothetical protein
MKKDKLNVTTTDTGEGSHEERQMKAIERGLDLLLTHLADHCRQTCGRSVDDLVDQECGGGWTRDPDDSNLLDLDLDDDGPAPTREWQMALALYGPDTVRAMLWAAIRVLGKGLHALGSDAAMDAACDRQRALRPGQSAGQLDVLNTAWDGIGDWSSCRRPKTRGRDDHNRQFVRILHAAETASCRPHTPASLPTTG